MKTLLLFVCLIVGIAGTGIGCMMIVFPTLEFIKEARMGAVFVVMLMCCYCLTEIIIELGKKND